MNYEWGEPGSICMSDWRDTIDQKVLAAVEFVKQHQGATADDAWAYVRDYAERCSVTTE
jgi:hypothetical protein